MTPKWLLFTEALYTFRNYIINTTVLSDHIGKTLFPSIEIKHIKPLKEWTIGKATARNLGLDKVQSSLEQKMQERLDSKNIYIEFDANIGKVTLHSEDACATQAIAELDKSICEEKNNLDRKLHDMPLSDGNPSSIVLRNGGIISEVLEPGEFNSIMLYKVEEYVSKADVKEAFEHFGPVSEVIQFKPPRNTWGKLTFQSSKSAGRAVKEFKKHELLPDTFIKPAWRCGSSHPQQQKYTVKARWIRRSAEGNFAFISFQDQIHMDKFLGRTKKVGNANYKFKRSREPGSLKVEGIHVYASRDEIVLGIENQYPDVKIEKCIIPRVEKEIESNDALQDIRRRLSLKIGRQIGQENERGRNFFVHMIPAKSTKAEDYEAQIFFNNFEDAAAIVNSHILIGHYAVRFELEKTSPVISVPNEIYHAVKNDLEKEINAMQNVKLNVKEKGSGKKGGRSSNDVEIVLESSDIESLSRARAITSDRVLGERLKFTEYQFRYFQTPSGKKFIETLKMRGSCLVKVDQRIRSMVLYGTPTLRQELKVKIEEKIEEKRKANQQYENPWTLDLNAQPNGFIKVIITNLHELTDASFININFLHHQLEVYGSNESLLKAKETLKALSSTLNCSTKSTGSSSECPVCFDALETTSYQLETCGHSYCKECIQSMCKHAAQNKQLPLKCAKNGCDLNISIGNILDLTNVDELVPAAVERFVTKNKDKYKYCITADCLNVYGVSSSPNPEPYQCGVCQTMICTFCHLEYHDNIGCQVKSRSEDVDLKTWLKEPGKDRGYCPKCSAPIERVDGCPHITCLSCKVHVCWSCKKEWFDTSSDCYDHLRRCGGIFS